LRVNMYFSLLKDRQQKLLPCLETQMHITLLLLNQLIG
jgi:hypothetical protein